MLSVPPPVFGAAIRLAHIRFFGIIISRMPKHSRKLRLRSLVSSPVLRSAIVLSFLAGLLLSQSEADESSAPEPITVHARALWLAEILKERKIPSDNEHSTAQIVLVEADGSIAPILRDEASRALFVDDRVRNRDLEVQARKFRGLPYLQVVLFRVRDSGGRWRIPEYYCDICTISVRYPQVCPCCQGDMEFRMKPENN